ncbi:MAG: glycosyltransferase family 39 protein [Ignavibacteriota bacterium]|nr:glycosyltransferase family 39 protein [Ignavibacteriota bacterium]
MINILKYFDEKKNMKKIYLFLVVFLILIKVHSIVTTDIQPWDEGMYTTRVLSIKESGDIIDQSQHSVGKFYSGSHPPLLIWMGYLATSVFGMNNVVLKGLIFIFSLAVLWLLMKIGANVYSPRAGIIAAIIFCSNLIFNIFGKRFQFDIPYTFLILLSFLFFLKYLDTEEKKYNYYSGIVFGFCLMIKILVGFFIPMAIFIWYILFRNKTKYTLKDLVVLSVIGIAIAAPWHAYMFIKYGWEFFNWFFFYHIYERALIGVEHNTKGSGYIYHINYLLTILPFGAIILFGAFKKLMNVKSLKAKEAFILVWFLIGFIIITLFKTKLEVYILLILTPGVFIAGAYLELMDTLSKREKLMLLAITSFNIFWAVLNYFRIEMSYPVNSETLPKVIIVSSIWFVISGVTVFFYIRKDYSVSKFFYSFILIFLFFINILYAVRIPYWENSFRITDVQHEIENSGYRKLIYVGSNYRHNPQFSFYFDGLDLGWTNTKYDFTFLDTKNGIDSVRKILDNAGDKVNVIIEKDKINRSDYFESKLVVDDKYKLILKCTGYELYRK